MTWRRCARTWAYERVADTSWYATPELRMPRDVSACRFSQSGSESPSRTGMPLRLGAKDAAEVEAEQALVDSDEGDRELFRSLFFGDSVDEQTVRRMVASVLASPPRLPSNS